MKTNFLFLLAFLFVSSTFSLAQNKQPTVATNENSPQQNYLIEDITKELSKISKSVEELNKKLQKFSETFSSNQGLKLTERQQKLLIAFEFLNRAEQRLVSLQNLKLNFTEKQTAIRLQLARITDDLLPASIRPLCFSARNDKRRRASRYSPSGAFEGKIRFNAHSDGD